MRYYPINIALSGQSVVVIGGGRIARNKIRPLLACGAVVTVIAPELDKILECAARRGRLKYVRKKYQSGDLLHARLVIAATNEPEVQKKVAQEAKQRRILLNVVDQPSLCDFTLPARVACGDFLVTISTGGEAPALAKKVRQDLEKHFAGYGRLVKVLGNIRRKCHDMPFQQRARNFRKLLDSPLLTMLKRGDKKAVDRLVKKYFGRKV